MNIIHATPEGRPAVTERALVAVTDEAPVAVVALDRRERLNALSTRLRDELEACLGALEADERIRAVVLTGGPECFSAGFDLAEVVETDFRAFAHRAVEFTLRTYFFGKPLVAAVGGVAYAGGFDLALSGDVIVAAETASLGRPEIRFGVNPLLTKLWLRVGMPRALQLSLSGEPVGARAALAMGLVDRVVPPGELLAAAREEARRIARHPLPALLALKRAARVLPGQDPRAAIEYEFGLTSAILAEEPARAALRDYARKIGVLKP
jgi:enoyl-CoA hydratase/carnithine racemase